MSPQRPSNTIARPPPPYRSLSQQKTSPPTRRGNEASPDRTSDGDGRSRLATSRLRVEVSAASIPIDVLSPPKSSNGTLPTQKHVLSPRGRPQLHRGISSVIKPNTSFMVDNIQNEMSPKAMPMPMPTRPRKNVASIPKNSPSASTNSSKKDPRPKPYVAEVPLIAPRFAPSGHSDFYPWTGNHPEDQFSENTIRQGYYDKSQMSQSEIGSARPFIFPALKHKSGLQMLSSVFTNILTQRRAHGQITSSSTFKPPPRVTVTDTKREMWLKDLANPTMSLRRLSRSIPHGIRGKVLLEQSLGKNIPIERAVWLAKCVGANELRSFRRKGVSGTLSMGGEVKWIRDFTICVEQFLENIIGACGEADFKTKFTYAVRLATHFHAEHLLDRDHYMDWLSTSIENSTQVRLPIWLLVIQIYWKDLLLCRKHGRKLSSSLLNHLAETSNSPDSDLLAPLSERLASLLKDLLLSDFDNFIAPKTWEKYRNLIYSHVKNTDSRLSSIFESIDTRNSRLLFSNLSKKDHPHQSLIRMLDQTLITPYSGKLAKQGWDLSEEKRLLIKTVLEWSSSSYRPGKTKVYVATRLLRAWSKFGVSITENVLNFLDSTSCENGRNKSDFYHVISELARSGHFSSPKYIQWLIARGGIQNFKAVEADGPCASRLLAELPTINLSESISRTRLTLLARVDFPAKEEKDYLDLCLSLLQRELTGKNEESNLEKNVNGDLVMSLRDLLFKVSRTVKSEIGQWLREKVCMQATQPAILPLNDWDKSILKTGALPITLSNFSIVRKSLEDIGDFSMLADVLKTVSSSCGIDILASCADTLNFHLETFAAIGALSELFEILLSRLRALPDGPDSLLRTFLTSLLDLSLRLEDQKHITQELAEEISRSYRKAGVEVCSPISDHMTGIESFEANCTEEIEKILATKNKMDHITLEQIFQKITSVLESSWEKLPEQQRICGLLLTKLRAFDTQQFDLMMTKWVDRCLSLPSRPLMIQFCAPLISNGCLTFRNVLEKCEVKHTSTESSKLDRASIEALDLLFSSTETSNLMSPEETYRFRIKQLYTQRKFPADAVSVLRKAFELLPGIKTFDAKFNLNSEMLLQSLDVQNLFQYVILFDADLFVNKLLLPILKSSNIDAISAINKTIDSLFSTNTLTFITSDVLLNISDDLSVPFCQMKLISMLGSEKKSCDGSRNLPDQVEALYVALESAVSAGKMTWINMISNLDVEISQQLREKAEARFFSLVPSPKLLIEDDLTVFEHRISLGKNLLSIIKATSCSIITTNHHNNNNATFISEIAGALNSLWLLLTSCPSEEVMTLIIRSWTPLLFSFIKAHATLFETSKLWPESRAKTILGLSAIFLELQALDISTEEVENLIEQSYDLALYFIDFLPDDARQQCIRSLRDTVSNPQISYLFSNVANPGEHLVLSQRDRNLGPQTSHNHDDSISPVKEKIIPFTLRRWEMLGEPTPNIGENDTSLSLTLFGARRG